MGKGHGPPSDRVQAGRIEKQRREEARRKLPAWYWRIATLDVTKHRDIQPEDYDEDISELGDADKSSEGEEEPECECDSDASECECSFEDKYNDNASEKTIDNSFSDAELYYELKDERKARKRDLLRWRLHAEKARNSTMEHAKAREEEVNTAYHAFKKARRRAKKNGDTIPLDFTMGHRGREYELFSTQHVEWLYDEHLYPTKRADFYLDNPAGGSPPKDGKERPMYGQIYLDWNSDCDFGPICIPKRARRKDFKFKDDSGTYDLRIKFFGDKYLKLSLPRAMVEFGHKLPPGAPERFEFVGVLRDLEKEKEERLRAAEERKKNRPASPRESYFEMNHPMGWWAQSRW